MNLIPYKTIGKYICLKKTSPQEIAKKLTLHGLETEVIDDKSLKFTTQLNRKDLNFDLGIIYEISTLLNYPLKKRPYFVKKTKQKIKISKKFIEKKIGLCLVNEEIENIWKRLGFAYQTIKKEDSYLVRVPDDRKDIIIEEDLIEEFVKIYGYDRIVGKPYSSQVVSYSSIDNEKYHLRKLIRSHLSSSGYQEIITYSLSDKEKEKKFSDGYNEKNFYFLLNPKVKHHLCYRQSLLNSHLQVVEHNLNRNNKNLFFFEISSIYRKNKGKIQEEEYLFLSAIGSFLDNQVHKIKQKVDYYWLKGSLENFFDFLGITSEITYNLSSFFPNSFQKFNICLGNKNVGFLGQINNNSNENLFIAQISLKKIFSTITKKKLSYIPVSNSPITYRDLTLLLEKDFDITLVIKEIKKKAGRIIHEVKIFDIYDKNNKKAVSFRLNFQKRNKTLKNEEVEIVMKKILSSFETT